MALQVVGGGRRFGLIALAVDDTFTLWRKSMLTIFSYVYMCTCVVVCITAYSALFSLNIYAFLLHTNKSTQKQLRIKLPLKM